MNTLIFPVTSLAAVSAGRFRMLIARCGESCWEPEVVLSFPRPLSNIRADVGGLNKSTANLTHLQTVPLNLLRRVFLHPLCQKKRGAQAELVFSSLVVSPPQQLREQKHV